MGRSRTPLARETLLKTEDSIPSRARAHVKKWVLPGVLAGLRPLVKIATDQEWLQPALRPLVRAPAVEPWLRRLGLFPWWGGDSDSLRLRMRSPETRPDWTTILGPHQDRWEEAKTAAQTGPLVLLATTVGGAPWIANVESLLAVALTLRGARVHVLLCDAALPACFLGNRQYFPSTQEFIDDGPTKLLCSGCVRAGQDTFGPLGLPLHRISELVDPEAAEAARVTASSLPSEMLASHTQHGIPVGQQALAGALRYYARGDLGPEPQADAVLRRFLGGALLTTSAVKRLFSSHRFASVVAYHGIYIPHGVIPELARQHGVRGVFWSHTYRKQTFIFSHEDTYHHTMLTEPTALWESLPWTPAMEAGIVDYLESRSAGTHDRVSYQPNGSADDPREIVSQLGLDPSRPCIALLTNVVWDAQVHYRGNAFPNMLAWVRETIRYFAKRPELQLVIRVHPAEVHKHGLHTRQRAADEIAREFPTLPRNVFVIAPETRINTYVLLRACDAALIYATKTGLELASRGTAVIVAGEAWVRNKGITHDARSAEEYFELLDRLPFAKPPSQEVTRRARKYAYHFFFRRMIPLPVEPTEDVVETFDDLLPGGHAGVDTICDGILKGSEFIYPAERLS